MSATRPTGFHLVLGNKNFSSWSLRGWLLLRHAERPFRETVIRLDRPETGEQIREHSEAGRVPVLHHGDLTIWDTMAIAEYVAEQCPEKAVWPTGIAARAMARSVSAEMHAGFAALREELPMDIMGRHAKAPSAAARADIDRILEVWRTCRQSHGNDGPFLFGQFSAADAMYAPVVTRFMTYGITVDDKGRDYMKRMLAHPTMAEWCRAAAEEVAAWGPTL